MKKALILLLKTLSAFVIAMFVMDVFCMFYYSPAEYVQDEYRATDTVRRPDTVSSRATEGFCRETMDAYGYNNDTIPGEDGVYALMMGSSHLEGLNLSREDNIASQLQNLLGEEKFVYNIGMSSHPIMRNLGNLERALERFRPTDYVILETSTVEHDRRHILNAENDTFYRNNATRYNNAFEEFCARSPFLCMLFRQFPNVFTLNFSFGNGGTDEEEEEIIDTRAFITDEFLDYYTEMLTELFTQKAEICACYGVKPVIFYHPHLIPQTDGTALPETDERVLKAFADACANADILFVDMTDRFLDAYANEGVLPHGFVNTTPGSGHLNADGCRMIAEAVYEAIGEEEAQ